MGKQLTSNQLPPPTSLKLTTSFTFSTKSFQVYFGYLTNHLLGLNFNNVTKVKVTDWKETKDSIVLRKVNETTFTLGIIEDCYCQSYSSLEEAVFDLVLYVENNILPIASSKRKGN